MSLPVPLTVRVGDTHITREVSAVQFRKEAIGGLKSISLRLFRPLDRFDTNLSGLSKVYLYDGRSAETIGEARLSDIGRSAGPDGQVWDMVGFGPAHDASAQSFPYLIVDTRLEPWRQSEYATKNATHQSDERPSDTPTLLIAAEEGKTVTTSWQGDWINRVAARHGFKLARVRCDWDAGTTAANYEVRLILRTGAGASPGTADSDTWDTAGGTLTQSVGGTNFNNGNNVVSLRAVRTTSSTTGTENHWCEFWDISVKFLRLDKSGAEITTGYGSTVTVLAHEIVEDLLGRVLNQYDGANATVNTTGSYAIDQAAWPDGVTAEQVLNDLMILEPAFRWYCKPDITGNGYQFFWEPWPTTVRYEATLDDGGAFPSSWEEVYNEVTVRWVDKDGRERTTTRTSTVTEFDNENPPITRSTTIDLGDEIGSSTAAARAGDNFLTEHATPKNAGSINVSRPIRDLTTGRMVEPFEVEPGELIRVRGVESYPDALNADSNDGQTVFRIWAMTYTSDTNTASLELDTDARTTTNALRKLAKRRNRKR